MNDFDRSPSQRPRLHPLVATAAVAVIVLSAVGVTAMVMNRSNATPSPYDAPPPAASAASATTAPDLPAPTRSTTPARVAASAPSAMRDSAPSTPAYRPEPSMPVTPTYEAPVPIARAEAPSCRDCGVIDSIREIKVRGQGTGVGAVGGAVVGGLLGNMVGAGRGKALATVAGAVGGGLGGNAIEKNVRSEVEHQMVVRLENGSTRTFTQAEPFAFREGERVRIVDGHVERG